MQGKMQRIQVMILQTVLVVSIHLLGGYANPLSPTGSFCCVIPTTRGETTFCVNIGTSYREFLTVYFYSGYHQVPMAAVVCRSLHLTNGTISYTDPTLGLNTTATHTCDAGYRLNTVNIRTCNTNASCSGPDMNCLGMHT